MKKLSGILLMLFLVIGVMAGCSNGDKAAKDSGKKAAPAAKSGFPVTITDGIGEKVTIDKKPKRIVSLIPSNTEIAFDLGLNKEIVGVSDFDNYPKEATKKEKIGGMDFNVEKIISLKPDLVLAHASGAHNSKKGLDQLRDNGIKVLVVNEAKSFDDAYKSIEMIGKATGTDAKAKEIVTSMKSDLNKIKEKANAIKKGDEKTVWIEVQPAPELYTAGKGTFMDEMLTAIHAKNAAAKLEGWPKVTEEKAVSYKPDVIITTYGYYTKNAAQKVLDRKAWKDVPAIKKKQVYDIQSDLVSRPGPRLIEGVEQLAEAVYPDVFKK
ncbi:ABC transporter substrate-binding protein [Fictibacillus gelatini]|uniref:ABC transporter substrate-binding protein n=1 Tax=Fictibacillus gelatini TaxID=225985 RepID=UPI0003FF5C11|nr:ABC transporter substrate-binding protein [Fictibacillus gelatini]